MLLFSIAPIVELVSQRGNIFDRKYRAQQEKVSFCLRLSLHSDKPHLGGSSIDKSAVLVESHLFSTQRSSHTLCCLDSDTVSLQFFWYVAYGSHIPQPFFPTISHALCLLVVYSFILVASGYVLNGTQSTYSCFLMAGCIKHSRRLCCITHAICSRGWWKMKGHHR